MSSNKADDIDGRGDLAPLLTKYLSPSPRKFDVSEDESSIADNDRYKKFSDSSHDMHQLPVAQVSPNIPLIPSTYQRGSTRSSHVTSGGHMPTSNQRPPVEGMTVDQWGLRVDGLGNDPNLTSNSFAVPHLEETLNQAAFVPDMTLKPREKHHSGSPSRRRSSSVPPKKRYSLPGQSETPTYQEPPGVHGHVPIQMQPPINVPNQQHQPLGPYDYHQSSHEIRDLTSWQRTLNPGRRDDLIGNKLKELDLAGLHQPSVHYYQPPYGGIQEPPPGVGNYPDPRLDPSGFSSTAPSYGTDYGGFERVIQAKDRILQEKDFIIQRQKMELQEKARQVQAGDRHSLYPSSTDKSLDLLLMKLQEKDYENHRLQAQLAQITQTKKSELDQLTQELGKTEYEVQKLMDREKDGQSALEKEKDTLAAMIKTRETAHDEIREKYRKLKDKYEHLKAKLQSVERHMVRLPTADEYAKSTQCIATLQQTEDLLKQRIASLESTLIEAREVRREKESVRVTLAEKNTDLEFEIQRLKTELGRMQKAMGAEDGTDPTSLKLCPQEEFDDIMQEKERLKQEVHKLKKVADSRHTQIRKMQSQHLGQVRDMERQLMQEEDCTMGLREEIKNRELDIAEMKKTLKDLSDQNQELLSIKMRLHEKNHKLEDIISSDRFKANQKLTKELSDCVAEVQGLLQVCLQTAEGAEPNVSMLLGIRSSSSMSVDFGHPETDEQVAQRVLEEVQQIRKDIDILRAHITDKYAESLGQNCITQ